MDMKKHFLLSITKPLCLALGVLLFAFNAFANTLSGKVDRLDISLNETFTFTLTYSAQVFTGTPDFTPLNKDFEIISTSQNRQYNSFNGQVESYTRWQLTLIPRRAGKLTIPSLSFKGEQSQAITVNVTEPAAGSGKFAGDQDIYLETETNKDSIFVQEQLLLTIRLYTNTNLSNISPEDLKLDNASSELVSENQFQRNINGRPYVVVERIYAIFPQNSGSLNIPAMRWDLQLGSRVQSLFDQLDNRRLRRLSTAPKTIEVKPAPADYPAGKDWLPATSIKLSQDWNSAPDKFNVGEPITRTVVIEAEGMSAAQIPQIELPAPSSINSYPETPKAEESKSADGITTTIRQTVAVVPTKAGEFELPAIDIPWWNTKTQQLENAHLPAQKVFVYSSNANLNQTNPGQGPVMLGAPGSSTDLTQAIPASEQQTRVANTENDKLPWQIATFIFAFLWLLFMGLTLHLWLRKPSTVYGSVRNKTANKNTQTEKQALSQLKRLCKDSNASADDFRRAVLNWANIRWPIEPVTGLQQVAQRLQSKELTEQIYALNQILYGDKQNSEFDGQSLVNALEKALTTKNDQDDTNERSTQLKPLYAN